MKITIIADPHVPVPPKEYGGTERIVALVCEKTSKNHSLTLFAGKDSLCYGGKLVIHKAPNNKSFFSRMYRKILFQCLLLLYTFNTDVIINFGRVDYLWIVLKLKKKILFIFQNPITQQEVDFILKNNKKNSQLIGISYNQIKTLQGKELFHIIYNAIDTSKYTFKETVENGYLAFLGRLTYNKGVDIAIEISKKTGIPLKIAGNISKEKGGKEFFETEIQPHLCNTIQWVGTVNDTQKNELLGGAIATLFPIRWEEPFGIVMIESLACGTPVIATNMGSVTEVIKHGETGFICNTIDEIISAVHNIKTINRTACRNDVEQRFSQDVMVSRYLEEVEILLKS
ncbi:MAG: glycosyltransferase family 4 protein [Bacteroidales bacterium]